MSSNSDVYFPGNWVLTRQQSSNSQLLPKENNAVITVNAEVSGSNPTEQSPLPPSTSQTKTRNVERPFVKGMNIICPNINSM